MSLLQYSLPHERNLLPRVLSILIGGIGKYVDCLAIIKSLGICIWTPSVISAKRVKCSPAKWLLPFVNQMPGQNQVRNGRQIMLKELWRKLEAGFLHNDSGDQDSQANLFGTRTTGNKEECRILPHITHTGEFHLERLTELLKARYGKSFSTPSSKTATGKTESDEEIRELISFAARIQDQDVQRELLLFYLNCSPVIQEYLRAETILGEGNFLSR